MIENGNLGKKSSKGFYKYSNGKSSGCCDVSTNGTITISCTDEEIVDRLVLIMVNEAVRCLEENVVESPKDVDFGMIMGTGWAPFRGGPISYCDNEGAKNVVERLQKLAKHDKYFAPCDMLLEYAKNNKKFYGEK
jgi:3-hydroxyacyl-CoA dehydrogenase/enoyl-CoA hydratase/3-hydroxybutyryl-CoA epimerase